MADLHIGDLVRHADPQGLHCATSIYDAAVVASVDPLVLVSDLGDMKWTQQRAADLRVAGRSPIYAWANVLDRLERDGDPLPTIPGTEHAVKNAQAIVSELERLACSQRELRSELLSLGTVPDLVSASEAGKEQP